MSVPKTSFLFLFFLFMFVINIAQEKGNPILEIHPEKYDFGDLKKGAVVSHDFKIINKGESVLIIKNVLTTCGCTATSWPKKPLAAGDSSVIRVSFDSKGKIGRQHKVITIQSNAQGRSNKIRISANILAN